MIAFHLGTYANDPKIIQGEILFDNYSSYRDKTALSFGTRTLAGCKVIVLGIANKEDKTLEALNNDFVAAVRDNCKDKINCTVINLLQAETHKTTATLKPRTKSQEMPEGLELMAQAKKEEENKTDDSVAELQKKAEKTCERLVPNDNEMMVIRGEKSTFRDIFFANYICNKVPFAYIELKV